MIYDGQTVTESISLLQIVRGQENGRARLAEATHLVPHSSAALWIETGSGFIEKQE